MKEKTKLIYLMLGALSLAACSQTNLNSPCPNFGRFCAQTPINVWHYNKA